MEKTEEAKTKKEDKQFDVVADFGIDVFNKEAMKKYLPAKIYQSLQKTIEDDTNLDPEIADDVAKGMKDWALSKGATHYTHWFEPLNGLTAEKHDSFITAPDKEGHVLMEFSGKELVKGEPDASSFPSGGLRATFEARGYTAWDCTSPAFVIHDEYGACLYIPTAFCSYTGEALDEKTPLLRSMDYLSDEALRVLRLFGDTKTKRVTTAVGSEQEYFLLDIDAFEKRKDLVYTGRTLFGAPAPKGQELDDHYFGPIRDKIVGFMSEVNRVLWRLGIPAKTEHNEVAPSQHELANIYSIVNVASDQNQIVMQILKRVAKKHGFICLLTEKPFDGINGSGKHNNWSINKDGEENLLKPGTDPISNTQFLVFLTAIIKGADEFGGLLRESVASYNNDFRLGANEAPPAIFSVFLGEDLQNVVDEIIDPKNSKKAEKKGLLVTGAKTLPSISKDSTDRNRTSPFAFTGNRFEFRMVGSQENLAKPNASLNTIVGYELGQFADEIEKASDKDLAIKNWIRKNLTDHSRVIFEGDGYSQNWLAEAEKRGLPNLKDTLQATDVLKTEKVQDLFAKTNVLTKSELASRAEVKYENYSHSAIIDAKTMSHMAHKLYLPSSLKYAGELAKEEKDFQACGGFAPKALIDLKSSIVKKIEEAANALAVLDACIEKCNSYKGRDLAVYCETKLIPVMHDLRKPVDELELLVSKSEWPVPSYGDLLFHIV